MGDLHLPFGRAKPMDIFGGWERYTERIEANWNAVVGEDDCVVIPGDLCWAMSLSEALPDFEFVSRRLKGRKIISKGNHDYWWTTLSKMNNYLNSNGFHNISILHNTAFEECGIAICGTRGWINDDGEPQDEKVLLREAGRLETSLKAAVATGLEPVACLIVDVLPTAKAGGFLNTQVSPSKKVLHTLCHWITPYPLKLTIYFKLRTAYADLLPKYS